MKTTPILVLAALLANALTNILIADPALVSKTGIDYKITLGGEVGIAAESNMNRFRTPPFDSVPWLRADLTGESAPEFDKLSEGGMPFRPFKNYSGDISGRFIEIMALNAQNSHEVNPAFAELMKEVPKHQRAGGYFCASGEIDWQKPIDRTKDGESNLMMPALWGNARMLCGLIEASRAFPENKEILETAKKLGDFYVGIVPRFTDPARMTEYISGTSYASGYVTCWFPAMEGLVKLSNLTGNKKYLDAAKAIAEFYKSIDRIPLDHSHGMLCCQVSLLLLFEATKDASYLERVEKRWDELVQGGYINPAGGILEKCKVVDERDEGCAEADWLRLNLELGRVTQKSRYWDMAERHLNNQFLQNQAANGGFGHHNIVCDKEGARGFSGNVLEATWCCDYHGQIGFVNLRSHLLDRDSAGLTCNLALEFSAKGSAGTVKSTLSAGAASGEVMRQNIQLDGLPASVVRIRQPQWADSVTAIAADGSTLPLILSNGYCATKEPVTSVEFVYAGGVYAEGRRWNRLPNGPVEGQPFALGFGPKMFAGANQSITLPAWPTTVEVLKAQGLELFSSALRGRDYRFVFDR